MVDTLAQKRILLIDDCEDDAWLLEHMLNKYHVKCFKAYTLMEALEFLERNFGNIWMICLDLRLGMDHGFEFLDKRSKQPELKSIPVIVMTSYADRKTIQLALAKGADDYMIKPIGSDLLVHELRRLGIIPDEEPRVPKKKKPR